MIKVKRLTAAVIALAMVFAAGCSSKTNSDKPQTSDSKKSMTLKVGVMPAVDSAPIFLAAQKGYFKDLGLEVDAQIYTNAMNRQSALQSGELDGAMTDVIALVNNVQNGFDIKVTTSTDGSFPILVKKDFKEQKDITVGMMEISVSNYLVGQALRDNYNVKNLYINEIPARLEMIKKGTMDMAILPEPIASQGEASGLEKRVYQMQDKFSPDIMVFTGKAIKDKEKALKAFHEAYNRAVEDIQKDPNLAKDILVEKLKVDPAIKDKIVLPEYHKARIPDKEYIEKIMKWNEDVLKKKVDLKYEALVEGKFVQ